MVKEKNSDYPTYRPMKRELNHYINSVSSYGEIKLFKELQKLLLTNYNCTFIEETHQQYVKFISPTTGCPQRRELSDLWIITYSPKRKKAKMTFLQAKLEKKPYLSGPFSFKGDYYQYDLLSKRPRITDSGKFNLPPDILSSAILESVGSFGVFYYDKNNSIDFAYSTASDISFNKKANCKTKSRQLYFTTIPYNGFAYKLSGKREIELRRTLNADCFEFGLINLLVGTPLESDKNILRFLNSYLKKRAADDIVVSNFIDFVNIIAGNDNQDFNGNDFYYTTNIFLLNIDRKEEESTANSG